MDVNYTSRLGIYYPADGDAKPNMDNCPEYWKIEANKVILEPAVLRADFFHGMGAVAYSAGMVAVLYVSLKVKKAQLSLLVQVFWFVVSIFETIHELLESHLVIK